MANTEWSTWATYVLKSLEELSTQHKEVETKVDENKDSYIAAINDLKLEVTKQYGEIKKEIGIIKTKTSMRAGLVGALVALIPSIAYVIIQVIK